MRGDLLKSFLDAVIEKARFEDDKHFKKLFGELVIVSGDLAKERGFSGELLDVLPEEMSDLDRAIEIVLDKTSVAVFDEVNAIIASDD